MTTTPFWPNQDIKPHNNSDHAFRFRIDYDHIKVKENYWSNEDVPRELWQVNIFDCDDDGCNFPFRVLLEFVADALVEKFGTYTIEIRDFKQGEDHTEAKLIFERAEFSIIYESGLAYLEFDSFSNDDLTTLVNVTQDEIFSHPGYGF